MTGEMRGEMRGELPDGTMHEPADLPRRRRRPGSRRGSQHLDDRVREARSLFRAGLQALAREEFGEARELLAAALAANPTDPDIPAYLGGALLALADADGAQAAVDLALSLGPDRFAPHQKAGELALRLGDPEGAAEHFLAAMRAATPGSPDAQAARTALAIARRQARRSINHRASLPTWSTRWRVFVARPRLRRGEP